MSTFQFRRFFSTDSTKAIKATKYGWLNAINYMAPAATAGAGNLCPHASAGCMALCLGEHSGQAAMRPEGGTNSVIESRRRKARWFMADRAAFLYEAAAHIARAALQARAAGMRLAIRMNGSTDIAWEGVRFTVSPELSDYIAHYTGFTVAPGLRTLFDCFPDIQFVDYTKNPRRFDRALPGNLDLTFSRSETNEPTALALLQRGVNVAVVFANALPATWHGFPVHDGDQHDLRHLDPKGGYVIGLSPKGNKAKRDTSGFVVH